jgi:hypothetical protein
MDYIAGGGIEELTAKGGFLNVGVEEKEEDDAEGHEVHVDAEDDTSVIPVPSRLHAADGVYGADGGDDGGKEQEQGGAVVGEVGEAKGDGDTAQDEQTAAKEGMSARIENAGFQGCLESIIR